MTSEIKKREFEIGGVKFVFVVTPVGEVLETPCTQAQWIAIMGEGTEPQKLWEKRGDDYPATYINYFDASEFALKLSQARGEEYRLPSDDEQHKYILAGRAEMPKDIMEEAVCELGFDEMPVVGTKRANPWGLKDASGLVWEWNADGPAK